MTILVSCATNQQADTYTIEEGMNLCTTYGCKVDKVFNFRIRRINPSTLISQTNIDIIKMYLKDKATDLIVWNVPLRARHHRNLERELKIKIIDKTALILEIFAKRAQTSEEHAQVKLATLNYQKTKLSHAWTHLERQKGSATTIGGPGESQYELDKRILELKIQTQKKHLSKIRQVRSTQRKQRADIPIIALVGYTNVGKTSLFNRLTKSNDYVENKLFATLGTHTKRCFLDNNKVCLVSDTVGFITNFPTFLMNAFLTTLEEIRLACLILHVRQISPYSIKHGEQVNSIINKILKEKQIPILEVWNKSDICEKEGGINVSSLTGMGIDILRDNIRKTIFKK